MERDIEKKQVLKDDVKNNKDLNIGLNLSVEQQDTIYNYIYGIGEEYLKLLKEKNKYRLRKIFKYEIDIDIDNEINKVQIENEIEEKINAILQEYVAPAVENDGGKISLIEYDEETKTAKMLLQGACSGCPSSAVTLKNGIEKVLKNFLPDVVESVEAING